MEKDIKKKLDTIESMLKWIVWKLTDGENIEKLMDAPIAYDKKLAKDRLGLVLKMANHEPDINDIYKEMSKKEKINKEK